jgi:beta-lactamase regulating signal transducer with metallopeptidase domain
LPFDFAEQSNEQIITHELSHIKLKHSFDILIYELFKIIFWFNPLIYLLGKSIKDIHEYEADSITIKSGYEKTDYMKLIMNLNFGNQFVQLANNFNQSTTLKRFKMMNAKKSQPKKVAKILYLIPILGILIYQFSCTPNSNLNLKGTVPFEKCTKVPKPEAGYQKFMIILIVT